MASANPATMPDGSAVGASLTEYTVPDVPIDTATSPGPQPDAERAGHVVAGARADDRPAPLARRPRRDRAPRARAADQSRSASTIASRSSR